MSLLLFISFYCTVVMVGKVRTDDVSVSTSTPVCSCPTITTSASSRQKSHLAVGSYLCYGAEEDISRCGSKCEDAENWDECLRNCSKDHDSIICKILTVSLFILGIIGGTFGTCLIHCILKQKRKSLAQTVSPEPAESRDGGLTEKSEYATSRRKPDSTGYRTPKMIPLKISR